MKAVVRTGYGSPDTLEFREVEKPVVKDDQALVRIHAVSLNLGDWHFTRGRPYIIRLIAGLRKPNRKNNGVGGDLAGRVEAVGRNVTDLRPGDEVFGMSIRTFAEYAVVSKLGLVPKPANVTFEEAAAVPVAAITALQGLRDHGGIQPGQDVLINGASGGVGTFAVEIAKSLGANVTGVCSPRKVDMVRSIGADQVIDYTKEDFTRLGRQYDLIFDVAGNHSRSECARVLRPKGALVLVGQSGRKEHTILPFLTTPVVKRLVRYRLRTFIAKREKRDLMLLKEFLETGKIRPVIDHTYPWTEVREAMGYLGEGHARGKVVLTIG